MRYGGWIQTFTGRAFWPLDPHSGEIDIRDVAHALALTCRFAGHCVRFYSVAEHSILLSYSVPRRDALWALMHDAAEAYSADIPKPLKLDLHDWGKIEDRLMRAVADRFQLPLPMPESVKRADCLILRDEQEAVMAPCEHDWGLQPDKLGVTIVCLPPYEAERSFLSRFYELRR